MIAGFMAILLACSLAAFAPVSALADPADDAQAAVDDAQATLDAAESRMAEINEEYEQLTAEVERLQQQIDDTAASALEAQQAIRLGIGGRGGVPGWQFSGTSRPGARLEELR